MKSVLDYINIVETAAAVNAVSAGGVAMNTPPIGKVQKRKSPATTESVLSITSTGVDPLANVQAKPTPEGLGGKTEEDSDEQKKHMFHLKQQYQNDQVSNL